MQFARQKRVHSFLLIDSLISKNIQMLHWLSNKNALNVIKLIKELKLFASGYLQPKENCESPENFLWFIY